jgi:hypothetical protein
MFKEVFVRDHSPEHTPGRVRMLKFIGIEKPMQQHGYARKKEASDSEYHEIEGIRVAGARLHRPIVIVALHLGMPGGRWLYHSSPVHGYRPQTARPATFATSGR